MNKTPNILSAQAAALELIEQTKTSRLYLRRSDLFAIPGMTTQMLDAILSDSQLEFAANGAFRMAK